MKILFLGGKRILGKAIVEKLLKIKKIKLYALSRFPENVKIKYHNINYLKGDRNDFKFMKKIIVESEFDIVFDNNCYDFKTFKKIYKIIKNRKIFYIFTSSIISYLDFSQIRKEIEMLKKKKYKLNSFLPRELALNKRKIELFLLKQKELKFCILKYHNIVGINDHSNKTDYLKNFKVYNLKKLKISKNSLLQFAYIEDIKEVVQRIIKKILKKKRLSNVLNIANNPLSYNYLIKINSKNKLKQKNLDHDIIPDVIVDNSKIKKMLRFNFTSNYKILRELRKET